jgi:hypothetical protein
MLLQFDFDLLEQQLISDFNLERFLLHIPLPVLFKAVPLLVGMEIDVGFGNSVSRNSLQPSCYHIDSVKGYILIFEPVFFSGIPFELTINRLPDADVEARQIVRIKDIQLCCFKAFFEVVISN